MTSRCGWDEQLLVFYYLLYAMVQDYLAIVKNIYRRWWRRRH